MVRIHQQQARQRRDSWNTSGRQQQQGTPTAAETLTTAGTQGTSTAVIKTTAVGMPETAETMTTAGAQATQTAEITPATAESTATAEATVSLSLY